ncbi:MAG: TIGR04133 family radical SAM/SPASM protein [Bacteroidales bacterium]|nr:TIGR04133 family radical SAM/SPASM protein [Bacteroidales bacterium]
MKLKQRIILETVRRMHHNNKQLHPLRQLFWESTLRCNLRCKHCGSDCKNEELTPDMPLQDFLNVLDSLPPEVDHHKMLIIVSGGEPLMREDLEQCGREFYKREFPWGMVSNGLALTSERFSRLLKVGLRSISISLDGFETAHNWMRGHDNSFVRASEAIRMIANTPNIKWDIITCVNQKNIDTLEEFKEYIITLGVKDWRLFTITPMGRAKEVPELQVSNAQFRQLMEFIKRTREEGRIHASYGCEGFLGDYEGQVRDHIYQCHAGVTVASVLIDGSISACTSIRGKYYQGNIYKDNFWDVWENRFQSYRDRSWMKKDQCADCKMFRYCEGNGMHLRDEDGNLMVCHLKRIEED